MKDEIFLEDAFCTTSREGAKMKFGECRFTACDVAHKPTTDLLSELPEDSGSALAIACAYGEDGSLGTWAGENMTASDKHDFQTVGLVRRDSCSSSITFSDSSTATEWTTSSEKPDDRSFSIHSFGVGVSGAGPGIHRISKSRIKRLQATLKNWWDDECAVFSTGHCISIDDCEMTGVPATAASSTLESSSAFSLGS
jgi:hypothetical protein